MSDDLKVEYWPLQRLRPYARNPRTHSEDQVARIAESIATFGFTNPILVDDEGGLIAGHGRLMAAQQLGLDAVPVIRLADMTPAQRRAYVIADNQLALAAGWDLSLLAEELHALNAEGFDLDVLGFDQAELDRLMAPLEDEDGSDDSAGASEDPDETPEPPRDPVTRPGDLWHLGDHRLLCGDSTDAAAMARVMGGRLASLCFTFPPYGQQRQYTTGGIGDWDALMQGVFANLPMAEAGQVLVNLGLVHRQGELVPYWDGWIAWMRAQGWRRFAMYCWDQGPGLPGDWGGRLAPSFEMVHHFNRKSRHPNKIVDCKYAGSFTSPSGLREADGTVGKWYHEGRPIQDRRIPDNVLRISRHKARGIEVEHPAVFPVKLAVFVMEAFTDPGETCFEPFSGSGTSIVAAQQCGRLCRAIELAPEYCDVAVLRFRELFPTVAVTLDDGRTFEQVAAERKKEREHA